MKQKEEDLLKLEFVNLLLQKNSTIKNQFKEFIQSKTSKVKGEDPDINKKALIKELPKITKQYKTELECIDLDEFSWEDYTPRHSGYIPEYEAMEHMAEDIVDEIFDDWEIIIISYLDNGDIAQACLNLMAQFNACIHADIEDPYDTLCDPQDYFIEKLTAIKKKIVPEMEKVIISPKQIEVLLTLLFEAKKETSEEVEEEIDSGIEAADILKFFEQILLVLTDNKEKAGMAGAVMKSYEIQKDSLPQLTLLINKLLGRNKDWIKDAELLYEGDQEVARQIMEYYFKKSKNDFLRVSKKIYEIYKNVFIDYLLEKVNKELDIKFYKKLLKFKIIEQKHFPSYKLLKPFIKRNEIDAIIKNFDNRELIKIQILEYEKRFDEILKLAQGKCDVWNFSEVIGPILNIFPKKCLRLIEKKCVEVLKENRGRNYYKRIVDWVQLAKTIKGYTEKTDVLIQRLYNWQPKLPALRDEMTSGGLL